MGSGLRSQLRPAALVAAVFLALLATYQFATTNVGIIDVPGIAPTTEASLALPSGVVRQEGVIQVTASGFRGGEEVSLRVRVDKGEPREFARLRADARGSLERSEVALPEWVISGIHHAEAVGLRSGRSGESVLRVRAKGLWVNLDDHSAKQGRRFGLVAGGFEPRERVTVMLLPKEGDAAEPVALGSVAADDVGNAPWTEFLLPVIPEAEPAPATTADEAGEQPAAKPDWWQQDLLLRGEQSGAEIRETITVTRLKPTVELSPWSGPPGTKIDLNVQGFLPHETVQVEYLTESLAPITLQADEYGNLWGAGPVAVPYDAPAGDLRLRLTGEESRATAETKFGVTAPKPWVELSSWSGYAGTGIFFSGGGWAAEEQVVAHLGSATGPTVGVGTSDGQGWLHGLGPTTVPEVPPDPLAKPTDARKVKYVLVGQRSGARATAEFTLIVPFFERQQQPAPPPWAEPRAGPAPGTTRP